MVRVCQTLRLDQKGRPCCAAWKLGLELSYGAEHSCTSSRGCYGVDTGCSAALISSTAAPYQILPAPIFFLSDAASAWE